jgi:hypothetical protein
MSALDDLLSDFNSNAGTMPAVNPPEAAKVLATQTAPEVAGEPEPEVVDVAPPPPTEKPAAVLAAEAAKTRKPRQPRAPKAGETAAQAAASDMAGETLDLTAAIRLVASLTPVGTSITIPGEA